MYHASELVMFGCSVWIINNMLQIVNMDIFIKRVPHYLLQ